MDETVVAELTDTSDEVVELHIVHTEYGALTYLNGSQLHAHPDDVIEVLDTLGIKYQADEFDDYDYENVETQDYYEFDQDSE